jgi:organic radical activating enzyme
MQGLLRAWRAIMTGRRPALAIEITRECPLSCPGCYAFQDNHLGGGLDARDVRGFKGDQLVERVMALVEAERPVHVAIVGGEPLVRYRELNRLLPRLSAKGIFIQVVTSAVRPIPSEWASIPRLDISVSIDGLQPEHDARRSPATYDRILRHIAGQRNITVHCTLTRQLALRTGDLETFVRFWSDVPGVERIWMSLYTPQVGELSAERLQPDDRARVIAELGRLAHQFKKLKTGPGTLAAMAAPPDSPARCVFAKVTRCLSADLESVVTPCQLGGQPECAECGCMASAGLSAVGRHRLPGGLTIGSILEWSLRVGTEVQRVRGAWRGRLPAAAEKRQEAGAHASSSASSLAVAPGDDVAR